MSQIRCEIEPTRAMTKGPSCAGGLMPTGGLMNEWGTMIHFRGRSVAAPVVFRYIRKMTVTTDSLYEEDFYAWTQEQAKLLRRLPAIGNEFDRKHIAEEIEDLGRSELHAAQSLCEHIIEHFLKLEYSGLTEPADHWRDEIVEWRLQLDKILTRSIIAKIDLPDRYRSARRLLRRQERAVPG